MSVCPHGAEPLDPCTLPPSTCFVHSPGAAPTLPDIDLVACVGFFPSWGCTQLETIHHGGSRGFAPSPLGFQTPSLRKTWGLFGCSPGPGGVVGAGGWGCCGARVLVHTTRKDSEKGSKWLHPPLTPHAVGFLCLLMACGMGFPSSTASLQAADPNHLLPAPTVVLVSHERQVGAEYGQGGSQNHLPSQKPTPPWHRAWACCCLPQLPDHLFMNQVLTWLVGDTFLMSKTFKISLNGLFSKTERSCIFWLGERQLV